jgi:hypothetical protein
MSLQPKGPKPEDILPIIIWGALSLSMALNLSILMFLDQIKFIEFNVSDLSLMDQVALSSNSILLISFFIHQNKVLSTQDRNKQFGFRVLTWALNESVVLIAFAAILESTTGNGAIFMMNLCLAFISNVIMFPRPKT